MEKSDEEIRAKYAAKNDRTIRRLERLVAVLRRAPSETWPQEAAKRSVTIEILSEILEELQS